MSDIANAIIKIHEKLDGDNNHRYKSWEHCYGYFDKEDVEIDKACLHMAFYLASWGMYRGSSFLLSKDYLIHKDVVECLLSKKHLKKIDFSNAKPQDLEEVFHLIKWIKSWYQCNIEFIDGKRKTVNVTDTLVTKILLGALGCIPAYDRYFIVGIKNKGLKPKLNLSNVTNIVNYYRQNHEEFSYANKVIQNKRGINYPPMKLVDMYFWGIGYELDQKKSAKNDELDS